MFNFSPGPSMLPRTVLKTIQHELLSCRGSGLSILEMSHRSEAFGDILEEAKSDLRTLMDIPASYEIFFMQGGATAQFAAVPLNLGMPADYIDSGLFAHLALIEAQKYGRAVCVGSSRADHYTHIPDYTRSPDARYVHITANNTVYGTRFSRLPDTGDVPLVADLSSCILSEPFDVRRFGVLYAGAQKNAGAAGVTLAIVRKDLLGHPSPAVPSVLNYTRLSDADGLLNTPNCFGIYVCGLMFKWLLSQGGVSAADALNREKSSLVYAALDENTLFKTHAQKNDRSRVNITFTTGIPALDEQFILDAQRRGLFGLRGHRALGGMRASLYNAMPLEGAKMLADFIQTFHPD